MLRPILNKRGKIKMNKSEAREALFKVMYAIEFQKELSEEKIDMIIESNEIEDKDIIKYIKKNASRIYDQKENLETEIKSLLKDDWTIERISKINIAILKIAIFEIVNNEVPYKVSINEAVNLAKKYADDASPAFINGILASIVEKSNK